MKTSSFLHVVLFNSSTTIRKKWKVPNYNNPQKYKNVNVRHKELLIWSEH